MLDNLTHKRWLNLILIHKYICNLRNIWEMTLVSNLLQPISLTYSKHISRKTFDYVIIANHRYNILYQFYGLCLFGKSRYNLKVIMKPLYSECIVCMTWDEHTSSFRTINKIIWKKITNSWNWMKVMYIFDENSLKFKKDHKYIIQPFYYNL